MTPLPKRRNSTRRGGKRKAAIHLILPKLIKCSNCGSLTQAHRICHSCGFYNGKEIVKKVEKTKQKSTK